MRILFISQLYDPEYSIKGQRLMEYWLKQGHEVEVLTSFPNYPTGKVFDGYKKSLFTSEQKNGVKITRVWSHISHSKSKISRAFSYISFTLMALFFSLVREKPDVVYTYHPQSTTGLIGILMRKFRKVKYITDVQDLWPDALTATGMNNDGLLIKVLDWWCKRVYFYAEHVVVLSEGYKKALAARGVHEDKISVVYNWCPEEELISRAIESSNNEEWQDTKPAMLIYAGNLGAAQNLSAVIEAVSGFSEQDVIFTLVGDGVEKNDLKKLVAEKCIENVVFKDYLPASEIFEYLSQADILLVHLKDTPLFRITIPSKTQSSMAMAKPLLMAVGGEANHIIALAEAGEVAEPENVESISCALKKLLSERSNWDKLGRNARRFYLSELSTQANYKKIDVILNRVRLSND